MRTTIAWGTVEEETVQARVEDDPKGGRGHGAPRNKLTGLGAAFEIHAESLDSVYLVRCHKTPNAAPLPTSLQTWELNCSE